MTSAFSGVLVKSQIIRTEFFLSGFEDYASCFGVFLHIKWVAFVQLSKVISLNDPTSGIMPSTALSSGCSEKSARYFIVGHSEVGFNVCQKSSVFQPSLQEISEVNIVDSP